MNKKLIVAILVIGAILAIALGIVVSLKSKDIKERVEQTLNQNFENFADNANIIESWEPFVCSGIINVGCYSKNINLNADGLLWSLKGVGIDIGDVDDDTMKATFNIKDIQPQIDKEEDKDEYAVKSLELLKPFFPNKITCEVSLEKEKSILFGEYVKCDIRAKNAVYEINGGGAYMLDKFKDLNVAQILEEFYLPLLVDDDYNDERLLYSLDNIGIKVQDNGFSDDLYQIYKEQSANLGQEATKEQFVQYANNIHQAFLFGTKIVLGDTFNEEFTELGKALESFLTGNVKKVGFTLSQKDEAERIFHPIQKRNEEILSTLQSYKLDIISEPK